MLKGSHFSLFLSTVISGIKQYTKQYTNTLARFMYKDDHAWRREIRLFNWIKKIYSSYYNLPLDADSSCHNVNVAITVTSDSVIFLCSNLLCPAGVMLRPGMFSLKVYRAEDIPQSKICIAAKSIHRFAFDNLTISSRRLHNIIIEHC